MITWLSETEAKVTSHIAGRSQRVHLQETADGWLAVSSFANVRAANVGRVLASLRPVPTVIAFRHQAELGELQAYLRLPHLPEADPAITDKLVSLLGHVADRLEFEVGKGDDEF